jgi:hypothetical protein
MALNDEKFCNIPNLSRKRIQKRMALKEVTEEDIILVNLISFISPFSVCSVVNIIDISTAKKENTNESQRLTLRTGQKQG